MSDQLTLLSATAVSIGFIHTVLGPDHYLPFIMLSKSKNWSARKTMMITFLCGVGHVTGSVVLGLIGIAVGISVSRLVSIESFRGNLAAWLFIAFGLVYMIISIRSLLKKRKHTHSHHHTDGSIHLHEHSHFSEHSHFHAKNAENTTPWVLFIIFVFGPCEPLIPILMYPAARNNIHDAIVVSVLFSVVTIVTMMSVVLVFRAGLNRINLKPLEKYSHVIAGAVIFLSGIVIQVLGL